MTSDLLPVESFFDPLRRGSAIPQKPRPRPQSKSMCIATMRDIMSHLFTFLSCRSRASTPNSSAYESYSVYTLNACRRWPSLQWLMEFCATWRYKYRFTDVDARSLNPLLYVRRITVVDTVTNDSNKRCRVIVLGIVEFCYSCLYLRRVITLISI